MSNKRFFKKYFFVKIKEEGFSFIEIILVVVVISIIIKISFPLFNFSKNKVKQKEATLIINSLIKAAKANYAINAYLPEDIKDVSKFVSVNQCKSNEGDLNKNSICYSNDSDNNFYSSSGKFKIEFRNSNSSKFHKTFQARAIPIGDSFKNQGSSVVGCFNPLSGISFIKEYSVFNTGAQPFNSCLTAEEERLSEEARLAEEARLSEEAKLAEEARLAEEERLAEEVKPKCLRWSTRPPFYCMDS